MKDSEDRWTEPFPGGQCKANGCFIVRDTAKQLGRILSPPVCYSATPALRLQI